MNAYFWIPLLSGLGCLAFAVIVLAREPWATGNRVLAAILASGAGWGVSEALWTLAPDAASAMAVLRGSVPAWAFLGPLALHLMAAREDSVMPRLPALAAPRLRRRRALRAALDLDPHALGDAPRDVGLGVPAHRLLRRLVELHGRLRGARLRHGDRRTAPQRLARRAQPEPVAHGRDRRSRSSSAA